jgi:hypothetical protein
MAPEPTCLKCGRPIRDARRSTRRYCSNAHRQSAHWRRHNPLVAHQFRIRQREAALDPRPPLASLDGCTVERIARGDTKEIIHKYEWLGTTPRFAIAAYGLRAPSGELIGVTVFGHPNGTGSGNLCGKEHRKLAICLQRGACVHWAPKNAASFLITRACRMAAAEHGWRIFHAYADRAAGEIGTIYQALKWLFLGYGPGRNAKGRWRFFNKREQRWYSERALVRRKLDMGALRRDPNWKADFESSKGRYVHFEGDRRERRELRRALRYPVLKYPRRDE